jgi:uncharacterized repeat protein (TIGR03803 family)
MRGKKLSIGLTLIVIFTAMLFIVNPRATAQTEKVLYSFNVGNSPSGSGPSGGLVFDAAGNLYGTTFYGGTGSSIYCSDGGTYGCGTAFVLTPQADGGWTETVLHNFGNVGDGANPVGGLIFDAAGNLYGTTVGGGGVAAGCGTVFELLKPQTGGAWTEKVLYTFCSQPLGDGSQPSGRLIFDGAGNLYGTTGEGGTSKDCSCGTVFELSPTAGGGWTEKQLHSFGHGPGGTFPNGGLTFDKAGNLYGVAGSGGSNCGFGFGCGVVFELISNGGGSWTEKVLYTFEGSDQDITGDPDTPLIFDAKGNLYGGSLWSGLFELSPNIGSSWTRKKLHAACCYPNGLVFDAAGDLFGTNGANQGGRCCGQAFKLTQQADGSWVESVLHRFGSGDGDGTYPSSPLIPDSAGNLYGTTSAGGSFWQWNSVEPAGTVFEITP